MLTFRPATPDDVSAIVALINLAYGGGKSDKAWTHEGTLFQEERTNDAEVAGHIATPGSMFLLGFSDDALLASTLLKFDGETGYLGLLAVHPDAQAGGVGRQMLEEAERMARSRGCTRMTMMVIATHRPELVSYYERRGYALTGRYGNFSRPAVKAYAEKIGMRLEWMEKPLA
jgi:ribosomal protein S18 acetylase RimI-like enzyme